jgi:hypothetical protein
LDQVSGCGKHSFDDRRQTMTFVPDCEAKDHWETPQFLWNILGEKYGPSIYDPCPRYAVLDGLKIDWPNEEIFCYVNPPYSRGRQTIWAIKCIEQFKRGCSVGLLLPFDTSTKLFNDILFKECKLIHTFTRRIKFEGAEGSPNFASALYIFDKLLYSAIPRTEIEPIRI